MTDDIALRSAANGAQARLLGEASCRLNDFYQSIDPTLSDVELLATLVQGYRDHVAWMQAKGAALAEEAAALRRAVGVDQVH